MLYADALLSRTRTYSALNNLIDELKQPMQSRPELADEVEEILNRTAGPTSYHRNDVLKQQILTHYRQRSQ